MGDAKTVSKRLIKMKFLFYIWLMDKPGVMLYRDLSSGTRVEFDVHRFCTEKLIAGEDNSGSSSSAALLNMFSICNGVTAVHQNEAEVLKTVVKFGSMREDAEVSSCFQILFQLCILRKLTTIFGDDPIKNIPQGRHYCYYLIASSNSRYNIDVDVKAGEIWGSAASHILLLCEEEFRMMCSFVLSTGN